MEQTVCKKNVFLEEFGDFENGIRELLIGFVRCDSGIVIIRKYPFLGMNVELLRNEINCL